MQIVDHLARVGPAGTPAGASHDRLRPSRSPRHSTSNAFCVASAWSDDATASGRPSGSTAPSSTIARTSIREEFGVLRADQGAVGEADVIQLVVAERLPNSVHVLVPPTRCRCWRGAPCPSWRRSAERRPRSPCLVRDSRRCVVDGGDDTHDSDPGRLVPVVLGIGVALHRRPATARHRVGRSRPGRSARATRPGNSRSNPSLCPHRSAPGRRNSPAATRSSRRSQATSITAILARAPSGFA